MDEPEYRRIALLTPTGVEVHVVGLDNDPRVSPGMWGPIGTRGLTITDTYVKTGINNTDWVKIISTTEA
jgi:hypothetical protein